MSGRTEIEEGWFTHAVRRYLEATPFRRAMLKSLVMVLWIALGAALVPNVFESLTNSQGHLDSRTAILLCVLLVAAFVIVAGVLFMISVAEDSLRSQHGLMLGVIRGSDEPVLRCATRLDGDAGIRTYIPHEPVIVMQDIVDSLWSFLSSHFGDRDSAEQTYFEVSFMSRSLRDGHLTIAAFRSDHGPAAPTMELRKDNVDLFAGTEAAKLIDQNLTRTRIIEDTSDPAAEYVELRPEQRSDLRSSVVHPVLDGTDRVVAALVVSSDRACFFKRADGDLWRSVCEPYGRRLALERRRVQQALDLDPPGRPDDGDETERTVRVRTPDVPY